MLPVLLAVGLVLLFAPKKPTIGRSRHPANSAPGRQRPTPQEHREERRPSRPAFLTRPPSRVSGVFSPLPTTQIPPIVAIPVTPPAAPPAAAPPAAPVATPAAAPAPEAAKPGAKDVTPAEVIDELIKEAIGTVGEDASPEEVVAEIESMLASAEFEAELAS